MFKCSSCVGDKTESDTEESISSESEDEYVFDKFDINIEMTEEMIKT